MSPADTAALDQAADLPLLTIPDVCARLRVSRWTFYQLVNRGQLATVKIGSRRLVTPAALERFIEELSTTAGRTVS